jgi:hypothetical protein
MATSGSGSVVVDNDRLGFEVVSGSWPTATADPGFWSGNYRTVPAGSSTRKVRRRPAVPQDGGYEIQVSFPPATTVRVDQRTAGVPDPRGGTWVSLGEYRLTAGLGTSVELTNDADATVAADAIRLLGPRT